MSSPWNLILTPLHSLSPATSRWLYIHQVVICTHPNHEQNFYQDGVLVVFPLDSHGSIPAVNAAGSAGGTVIVMISRDSTIIALTSTYN